ncbi:hypothetical protein [Streptomyces cavernae]|uniref:hypothetical protein n=1 Tax=Streptomyces cavernae TaxID=2259034 RepID=UPI000FEC00B9|nr:hypothetical protein [Streptomyces cavernae]
MPGAPALNPPDQALGLIVLPLGVRARTRPAAAHDVAQALVLSSGRERAGKVRSQRRIGLAQPGSYWTQDFGTAR